MNQTYGVSQNDDLKPGIIKKDTRPLSLKFKDFMLNEMPMLVQAGGILLVAVSFFSQIPFFNDAGLIVALILLVIKKRIKTHYDFFSPGYKASNGRIKDSEGMFMLSNNLYKNFVQGWISRNLGVTHWLVFGSTGSGKTRFLLGVFYQVAMYGGGCIYVDGKGDNTVWWLFYSMARKVGREEDVLLMSYLTGGGNIDPNVRVSNTCNPFTMGNANQLASIVVGLMRSGGGDDMWKGRAIAMLKALMHTLVDKRDRNELELNIEEVRNHLTLDKIMELSQDKNIGKEASKNIMHYLEELPGFKLDDMLAGKLNGECYKQHGFLQMQLTEVMGDLSSTYKHIYGSKYGEIDYTDVVFNKRLLFVILPALEKNPDELSGLGKMVVASIRGALAPALGMDVEGNKVDVLDSKPTNAAIPFTIILDEYGYYAVEGFAVVAAQARSLGVQVIYAGQDYPSLKKGSEIEAQATVANTNIKIAMKIEDMDDTANLFINRAGEADVSVKSGDEMNKGFMGGYREQDTTRIERRKRIDARDLVKQKPGQAHIIVEDTLERVQLFYADPLQTENITINRFVPIKHVDNTFIESVKQTKEKIKAIVTGTDRLESKVADTAVTDLAKWFKLAISYNVDPEQSAQFAIGASLAMSTLDDLEEEEKLATPQREGATKDQASSTTGNKHSNAEVAPEAEAKKESGEQAHTLQNKTATTQPESKTDSHTATEINSKDDGYKLKVLESNNGDKSVQGDAGNARDTFITLLDDAVKNNLRNLNKHDEEAIQDSGAEKQISKLAKNNESASKGTISELKGISKRYPNKPTPSRHKQQDLQDHLNWIINKLKAEDLR